MEVLKGQNAVITGGGSGIGRGIALALAHEGVNLILADIQEGNAQSVAEEASALGVKTHAIQTDVTDRSSVAALAHEAYETFGAIHFLSNNAGINFMAPLDQASDDDWHWIMSVNLYGIIHSCSAFVPRMKAQGVPAHIINNASMAALVAQPIPGLGLYNTTKHACLGYTESLKNEVEADGIGVSVLCPGMVASNLGATSAQNRPEKYGGPMQPPEQRTGGVGEIMTAETCGEIVVRSVKEGRFLIITHPDRKAQIEDRYQRFLADFDAESRAQAQEG